MGLINDVRDRLMTLRSLQIYLSIYYGYMLAGSLSILTPWFGQASMIFKFNLNYLK